MFHSHFLPTKGFFSLEISFLRTTNLGGAKEARKNKTTRKYANIEVTWHSLTVCNPIHLVHQVSPELAISLHKNEPSFNRDDSHTLYRLLLVRLAFFFLRSHSWWYQHNIKRATVGAWNLAGPSYLLSIRKYAVRFQALFEGPKPRRSLCQFFLLHKAGLCLLSYTMRT